MSFDCRRKRKRGHIWREQEGVKLVGEPTMTRDRRQADTDSPRPYETLESVQEIGRPVQIDRIDGFRRRRRGDARCVHPAPIPTHISEDPSTDPG